MLPVYTAYNCTQFKPMLPNTGAPYCHLYCLPTLTSKIRRVFHMDDKKAHTCLQIIELSPEETHEVADMIIAGRATSVPKALAMITKSEVSAHKTKNR